MHIKNILNCFKKVNISSKSIFLIFLFKIINDLLIGGLLGALLAWGPLNANRTILVPGFAILFALISVLLRVGIKITGDNRKKELYIILIG